MGSKLLLKGGVVLTFGTRTPNFAAADVLVEDQTIVEVAASIRSRDAEVIDVTGSIVMPGFVDTHRHAWQSMFRNLGPLETVAIDPMATASIGKHYSADDVYASTLIGLLGALEAGITSVVDWSDIQIDHRYTEAVRSAHSDSGLRTVLVHSPPTWADDSEQGSDALRRAAPDETSDTRSTLAYGALEPRSTNLDALERDWAVARDLGMRIHAHAGVDQAEGGVVSEMAARGLMGEDVTLVHCSHLTAGDLDAIRDSKSGIVFTPVSEMTLGIGSPPIQALIDRTIRPGLGIDNELGSPGDMFAQMRAVISLQHATLFDLKLAGKAGVPQLLGTRDVIRYATVDGARVAGLGGIVGTLDPGMRADLIVLRTDRANIFPINDPIGAVVWGMDTSNVDTVVVDGRPLMREGSHVGDVGRARDLAMAAHLRVAEAAGLVVGSQTGTTP